MNSNLLSDWLGYINSNRPNEDDFGLERLRELYKKTVSQNLANKVVIVGGTNGKGTTVEYLKNFLIESGSNVGVYTSPHLINFNERIRINNRTASDDEIVRAFKFIENNKNSTRLTYFDYATLAAFKIFAEENLDFAILEIGIGGKYDPVNLIESDISIITNIDLDHEKWLGSTLEQIGLQKAAILKQGKIGILGSDSMPLSVTSKSKEICKKTLQLGKEFRVSSQNNKWSYSIPHKNFELEDIDSGNLNHESAACALSAYKMLLEDDIDFKKVIEATHLPGRCHSIEHFILDVSHNPASVKNLIQFLDRNHKDIKFNAIFSAMSDKDCESIINEISQYISEWNICSIEDTRFDISELINITEQITNKSVVKHDSVYSAVERSYHEKVPCIVFGSFITVSQAYQAIEKIKKENHEDH